MISSYLILWWLPHSLSPRPGQRWNPEEQDCDTVLENMVSTFLRDGDRRVQSNCRMSAGNWNKFVLTCQHLLTTQFCYFKTYLALFGCYQNSEIILDDLVQYSLTHAIHHRLALFYNIQHLKIFYYKNTNTDDDTRFSMFFITASSLSQRFEPETNNMYIFSALNDKICNR